MRRLLRRHCDSNESIMCVDIRGFFVFPGFRFDAKMALCELEHRMMSVRGHSYGRIAASKRAATCMHSFCHCVGGGSISEAYLFDVMATCNSMHAPIYVPCVFVYVMHGT